MLVNNAGALSVGHTQVAPKLGIKKGGLSKLGER